MCGIAGFCNISADINRSKKLLHHRGPDDNGEFIDDNLALVHTRLAIQDIQYGKQPFIFEDFVIIFNGEIYNHLEIRENYLKKFKFKTNSDTETLLYLYLKKNKDMFDIIDGMFAFCIYDKNRKTLFLARDRAGKKPLYYYIKDKKFAFASELKVLQKILNPEINYDAINQYLSTGFFYKPYTPYKDIFELENGTWMEINLNNFFIKKGKFFNIEKFYTNKFSKKENEIIDEIDDKLTQSVKNRLFASDVEVGAFLSGGIDSGLIVAKASEFTNIRTFTVKIEGNLDESSLAELVAKKYSTKHTIIEISMDLKNDIEKILLNYGKPFFDSSAIPSYYVSRQARKYVKVILNGDGADELFAGYRRYVPIANNWINFAKYFSFLQNLITPESRGIKMFIYRLLRLSKKKGINFYNVFLNDIFEDFYSFNSQIISKLDDYIKKIMHKNFTPLSKVMLLDFELNLVSDLVVKMDIATMSNSLEGRSPFLSKYFLEYAPQIQDNFKINGFTTKYILRKLAKRYLPEKLITQPKRGFEVPLKKWVNNELREVIFDYLNKGCFSENFIERKFIDKLLEKKIKIAEEKRAKMLWIMFTLEVWKKNI
ncbi:asparagine synthase (glutamine-hydrolyzing) [Hippea jasoniae]|uniref:asparagine synthase (glutamine-hydrolyzing) n=1 Tax=Hippea jasoniae TaxID=944479 RepID=UPI00054DA938|nr:asparagine synthase (glutamine-hydrolyzing) [Hippea jasoniae]